MFGLQPVHLVLILIVALIIFGPQRLPELGRALGKSISEFKSSTKEIEEPFRTVGENLSPSPRSENVAPVARNEAATHSTRSERVDLSSDPYPESRPSNSRTE